MSGDYLLNPNDAFFPEPNDIAKHAMAFAMAMFAHTAFERQVAALQDAVTRKHGFGEQRANQWPTRQRSKLMRGLIENYCGQLSETDEITRLLDDAVDPCEQRHLLAHGSWWRFDRKRDVIIVRSGTRWANPEEPPDHREYSAGQIAQVAEKLKNLEAELYKLRRSIEAKHRPTPPLKS